MTLQTWLESIGQGDLFTVKQLPAPYNPAEQLVVLETFWHMLAFVTRDGGRKRKAGKKPPWWRDNAHEAALFSHLNKWKRGELVDTDSGAHPLVHLAWRALAIAYQETYGQVEPSRSTDRPAAPSSTPR